MAAQSEWLEKDYYKVLGVSEGASQKDITSAYRKLARENHPDANPGDAKAEERFKEVSAAYQVIGDAEKRKEYDQIRRMGPMAGGLGGNTGPFHFTTDDIGDLFGGLFNRGGRGGAGPGRGGRGAGPQRGDDLQADLHLGFVDAAKGVTTEVHLTSDAACSTCSGSGAKPGTTPQACSRCGGRGVLDDNQGFFSFSQPCPGCAGRGTIVEDPCGTCRGTGVERRSRKVKVRIPAGVADGQQIRLKGRGGAGRNGGPAGDLYVNVAVGDHDHFGRTGKNLTLVAPITYSEAVLGADIRVPTLDGDPVTLRVPPGTRSGRTFRVKGKGVTAASGGAGDLLVTVEVAVPANPSSAERKLVEQLAEIEPEVSPRAHLGV